MFDEHVIWLLIVPLIWVSEVILLIDVIFGWTGVPTVPIIYPKEPDPSIEFIPPVNEPVPLALISPLVHQHFL